MTNEAVAPPAPTPAPTEERTTKLTFDEVLDSLTGYDEIAIKTQTENPLSDLLQNDSMHAMRATIGIHLMREAGESSAKHYRTAYQQAMSMTTAQVRLYFSEAAKDPLPDSPDSPAGKESSPNGSTTTT